MWGSVQKNCRNLVMFNSAFKKCRILRLACYKYQARDILTYKIINDGALCFRRIM